MCCVHCSALLLRARRALHRRELRAIAGIASARLAAHFAIRFSLRLNLPSDAIAVAQVVAGSRRRAEVTVSIAFSLLLRALGALHRRETRAIAASLRLAWRLTSRSGSRFARTCLRTRSQWSRLSRGYGGGLRSLCLLPFHSSFGRWAPSIVVKRGAIAGIASARLAARCAIRFSLRSDLPSGAIANPEVVAGWLGSLGSMPTPDYREREGFSCWKRDSRPLMKRGDSSVDSSVARATASEIATPSGTSSTHSSS
ncbi:hypothetical protein BZB76_3038 [Actinomadura pelletieri DSM 43383]|uniref:Uncharacterized protein n=1 Tax=Actinomadura pelletieri DSM 43383 TaxID=1120940 RepID=A0A495QNI3_9ACTN|nr:hypothetical protein BZB76_3038 [Actinomadura pelletieri DSM 43383]